MQAHRETSTRCQKISSGPTQVSGRQLIGAESIKVWSVSCASSSQDRAQLDQLRSILFPKSHTAERGDPQDTKIGARDIGLVTFENNEDNNKNDRPGDDGTLRSM